MHLRRPLLLLVPLLALLAGSLLRNMVVGNFDQATDPSPALTADPSPALTADPSPPIAECFWQQSVSAWVDANGNRQRDTDEQPLAGVEFLVKGLDSGLEYGLEGTSDTAGLADLSIFFAGCPDERLELTARPPTGYRAATAERVEVRRLEEEPIAFGFVAAP